MNPTEINENMEGLRSFIAKHEKKHSGFMSGLFNKNGTKN